MNIQQLKLTMGRSVLGFLLLGALTMQAYDGPTKRAEMQSRLEFYLHSVKCVNETNYNNRLGSDEIYLGGETVGPDKKAHKIPVFKVHGDFDKGEVKTYNPPLRLRTFDGTVNKSGPNPVYHVSLVLVEKDNDNFAKFFDQYDDKLKKQLKESATEDGDPVLIALSQLAGPVFNEIKKILGDDPFPPKNVSFKIPTAMQTGGGSSGPKTLTIKGNGGGHYVATYEWRVVRRRVT
jgi:hypothetical protein